MKRCSKCKFSKSENCFAKRGSRLQSFCKECQALYRIENQDKLAKYFKLRNLTSEVKTARKLHYQKNKQAILSRNKKYRNQNHSKICKGNVLRDKNRRKVDWLYKFKQIVRNSVYKAVTQRLGKSEKTEQILGCSFADLHKYLESKFQPGMSWGNQGKWHIDHIRPLASATTEVEVITLCHYTNLQPLWAKDNLSKGAKYGKTDS